MIGRKPDKKLGDLMTELRDTLAMNSSLEQQVQNLIKENERLSDALDNRPWLARIEELELELADYKGLHAARDHRVEIARERADAAEAKMSEMKEKLEEILTTHLEQLG